MKKKMLQNMLLIPAMAFIASLFFGSLAYSQDDQMFTVSGSVTDKATGKGIQASIVIYAQDKNAVEKAMTKEDGTFSVTLKGGVGYRFAAYPWTNDYDVMFYDNANDLAGAKTITLDKDYSGIDFALAKKKVYDNGIHGIVKNEAGDAIYANVIAWPSDKSSSSVYYANLDKMHPGNFTLSNLRPGQYILFAQPLNNDAQPGYYKENDLAVQSADDATLITVPEEGVNSEDYIITLGQRQATKTQFEIKGIVSDENKQPIEGVNISIVNSQGTEVVTKDKKTTDATGSFVIFFEAEGGDKYMLTAKKDGYADANYGFYLDEKNPAQAAFITMTEIDNTVYDNGIKGMVVNKSGEGILSKVTVIRVNENGSYDYNKSEKTVVTNKEKPGEFRLDNLKPGNYVIFASPCASGLESGYYKENKEAVPDVMNATIVSVGETGINQANYVITLPVKTVDPNTKYELWGYVIDENNSPLSDVVITATDANGNDVIANQENHTDKNGMFHLVFNSPGTFSLKAVKDGYIDASGVLTFNENMPKQKTLIKMYVKTEQNSGQPDSKIAAGVKDNVIENSVMVYPNPVKSVLNISTGELDGKIDVRIYSITGRLALSGSFSTGSGMININTETLEAGSYILRIYSKDKPAGTKVFVKE